MELQYINLIKHILENGISKDDRTGIGTLSIFSYNMTFNLRESFPLLTTKKVYWKGVVEELLWFISGSTDSNILKEKGVKIWEGNSSREFLDSRGLSHYDQGDIGAGYGFQWRHFGAKYTNMYDSYEGKGIDQLKDVIYKIKTHCTSQNCHFNLDFMIFFYETCNPSVACTNYHRFCTL